MEVWFGMEVWFPIIVDDMQPINQSFNRHVASYITGGGGSNDCLIKSCKRNWILNFKDVIPALQVESDGSWNCLYQLFSLLIIDQLTTRMGY